MEHQKEYGVWNHKDLDSNTESITGKVYWPFTEAVTSSINTKGNFVNLTELQTGWNQITYKKFLEEYLAYSRCSINVQLASLGSYFNNLEIPVKSTNTEIAPWENCTLMFKPVSLLYMARPIDVYHYCKEPAPRRFDKRVFWKATWHHLSKNVWLLKITYTRVQNIFELFTPDYSHSLKVKQFRTWHPEIFHARVPIRITHTQMEAYYTLMYFFWTLYILEIIPY